MLISHDIVREDHIGRLHAVKWRWPTPLLQRRVCITVTDSLLPTGRKASAQPYWDGPQIFKQIVTKL